MTPYFRLLLLLLRYRVRMNHSMHWERQVLPTRTGQTLLDRRCPIQHCPPPISNRASAPLCDSRNPLLRKSMDLLAHCELPDAELIG